MIVGRLFTYLKVRYEPGSDFDIHIVAESRRPSFIRAFGLSERPAPRKKKRSKRQEVYNAADEAGMEAPALRKEE